MTHNMTDTLKTLKAHGGRDDELARDGDRWRYHAGTVKALERRGLLRFVEDDSKMNGLSGEIELTERGEDA